MFGCIPHPMTAIHTNGVGSSTTRWVYVRSPTRSQRQECVRAKGCSYEVGNIVVFAVWGGIFYCKGVTVPNPTRSQIGRNAPELKGVVTKWAISWCSHLMRKTS